MSSFLWRTKNRFRLWLGITPSYIELDVGEPERLTLLVHRPDPEAVRRRQRLVGFSTSQWTVSLGAALFAIVAGKIVSLF